MSLTLERLLFDPADAAEGPNIGAFLRGAGGDVLTSSTVGGKKALDVSIADGVNVEVDLSHVDDSVKIGDGTDFLAINGDGSINAVVSATNLDIRDLAFASDSVTAHQGGSWTVTATATDFDIRDLAFATDSVTAHQGGTWNINSITNAVTVTATDLDIRDLAFATDKVDVSGSSITATVPVPNGTVLAGAVSVTTSATVLPASALANRKRIEVQNNGDKSIFIGGSGVTTSSGVEVPKGGTYSQELGPSALIYAICASGTVDVRVLEIS